MILETTSNVLAVCRLDPDATIPRWALSSSFFSLTRTTEELSIVCSQVEVPNEVKSEKNWRFFKVRGPLDFGLTGILASLANPLAAEGISIFAISTFDTDYLMVKQTDFRKAVETLSKAGHEIFEAPTK